MKNATTAHHAIKTFTAQLIARVGGLEAGAACCRVGKTRLAEYQDRNSEHYMPADVMLALEQVAGEPVLSAALVRMQGCGVTQPEARPAAAVATGVAALSRGAGELAGTYLEAAADGVIDAREAARLRALVDQLREAGEAVTGGLAPGAALRAVNS